MEKIKISKIKLNPNNPRIIKDEKFKKLVKSIQDFPEMLSKRPIVCVTDNDGLIFPLGGNMRLKALQELKFKEIPKEWIMMADEWSEQQRDEFLIKDNVGYGEWDFELIHENWDVQQLEEWGLDVPAVASEVDYSILDEEDVDDQLKDMTNGVKKAIQIEFESEDYEKAQELVKFFREQGGYIGGMILDFLKSEKEKV